MAANESTGSVEAVFDMLVSVLGIGFAAVFFSFGLTMVIGEGDSSQRIGGIYLGISLITVLIVITYLRLIEILRHDAQAHQDVTS